MAPFASYEHLRSRLSLVLALNAAVIVAEFLGGWFLDSIGLMSDAGHNLVDQGALFLALYAHLLTARPATEARTFGYHRAGIIAAFLNSFILLLTAIGIGVSSRINEFKNAAMMPARWYPNVLASVAGLAVRRWA